MRPHIVRPALPAERNRNASVIPILRLRERNLRASNQLSSRCPIIAVVIVK